MRRGTEPLAAVLVRRVGRGAVAVAEERVTAEEVATAMVGEAVRVAGCCMRHLHPDSGCTRSEPHPNH